MNSITYTPFTKFEEFKSVGSLDDLIKAKETSIYSMDSAESVMTIKKRRSIDQKYIVIHNAKIIVDECILYVDSEGRYFPDFYSKYWQYKFFNPDAEGTISIDLDTYKCQKLEGTWVGLASSVIFGNIFHALIDNYARLSTIPQHWLSSDINFAMGFNNDILGNTGIFEKIFFGKKTSKFLTRGVYEVDRLILPPLAVSEDYMSIEALKFVNQKLLSVVRNPSANHLQRLFISRSDAQTRKLLNEDSVKEALRKYGFMTICPGDYNLITQLELFASAEIIAGVHGMGLTSMFVAGSHTKALLEYEAYDWEFTAYATIASALDIPYDRLPCTITERELGGMYDWRAQADINGSLEMIDKYLQI